MPGPLYSLESNEHASACWQPKKMWRKRRVGVRRGGVPTKAVRTRNVHFPAGQVVVVEHLQPAFFCLSLFYIRYGQRNAQI